MTIEEEKINLAGLDMWEKLDVPVNVSESVNLKYSLDMRDCRDKGFTIHISDSGNMKVEDKSAISWAITPDGMKYNYKDNPEKPKAGLPLVRGLIYLPPELIPSNLYFRQESGDAEKVPLLNKTFESTDLIELKPEKYDIYLNDKLLVQNANFKLGGVYTILGYDIPKINKTDASIITVTPPNSMHLFWLLPQYIVITIAEVMFSVTGPEFAFTQSPPTMKALMQSCWLLTVAFGNLIVVIIAKVSFFERQVYEFFLFAGLMFLFMTIFTIMAMRYKYVDVSETSEEEIVLEGKDGTVNPSYKDDEK